jgi:hypothetical protein
MQDNKMICELRPILEYFVQNLSNYKVGAIDSVMLGDGQNAVSEEVHRRPQEPAKRKHRSDIDGLRAVAILPVMLFHAEMGCTGGFVGVDVFFVISGPYILPDP